MKADKRRENILDNTTESRDRMDEKTNKITDTINESVNEMMREFDSCGTDTNALRETKARADHKAQELMGQLQQEWQRQDEEYRRRADQLRQDEQYKADMLQAQLNRMAEEKAEQDRLFQERMNHLLAEQAQHQKVFQDRRIRIDELENQRYEEQQAKIRQLEQERLQHEQAILDRIAQLKQEIEEQRLQYQNRINQLNQETPYKEEPERLRVALEQEWAALLRSSDDQLAQLEQERIQQDGLYEQAMARLRGEMQKLDGELSEKIGYVEQEKIVQQAIIQDRMSLLRDELRREEELYQLAEEKERLEAQYRKAAERINEERMQDENLHEERREELEAQKADLETAFLEKTHREWVGTLCRMKEVEDDYKVADRDKDVRGWDVVGQDGEKIGKVDEFIVDMDAMKVRYLDVELDNSLLDTDEDHHVLIPIGVASLDGDHNNVMVPVFNQTMAKQFPAYRGEPISRDYEYTLLVALSPDYQVKAQQNNTFYDQSYFDEGRFYNVHRS